jgi:hypothetical protein
VIFRRLIRGVDESSSPSVVGLRDRRRSLKGVGGGAWVMGGVGSWLGEGEESIDCRARQVAKRVVEALGGGEVGGEEKRAAALW